MMLSEHTDKFDKLRQQAEAILRQFPTADTTTYRDLNEIIHELNIHQAELEIQNNELQRSQAEYAQLHKEFSDLYEFAPCGYIVVNAKGIITRANLTAVTLLGETRDRILKSGMSAFIHDSYHQVYYAAKAKSGRSNEKQSIDVPLKSKQETPCWVRLDIEADRDGETVNQWRITLIDITLQKQAEESILQAKKEWEQTFDTIGEVITILDKDMRIVRANKATYELFEARPDDILGKHCYEVFQAATHPCLQCPILKTWDDAEKHSGDIYHANLGKIFHVIASPRLNQQSTLQHVVYFAQDITKQKKIEEELFQAHKIEAIGTLAGGIAHDFNNLLGIMLGFAQLALFHVPSDNLAREHIEQIVTAGDRAAFLVRQILTFCRKGAETMQPVMPVPIIKEGLELLRSTLPATVNINREIAPDCGLIICNPTYIHQVLVNICTNAFHAMVDEKGDLTIKLRRIELSSENLTGLKNIAPGPFLELTVSDTGSGIDQKIIEKIFEPYFTTKAIGKGSGMGLSVVHGIVQECGGFIEVDSEIDKGSTFKVFFPAILEELIPEAKKEERGPLPSGNERVLVIDDEKHLIDIYKNILERQGYHVIAHHNSAKALADIQQSPDDFDLVITDQAMPHLSGAELAREILAIRPDMPVILCTGFSSVATEEKANEIGIKKLLMKPVSIKKLSFAVREVLDRM